LGCVWASVLKSSSERLEGQWSSQAFWDRFVPAGPQVVSDPLKMEMSDLAVMVAAAFVLVLMGLSI
jgi:hypothetical protein